MKQRVVYFFVGGIFLGLCLAVWLVRNTGGDASATGPTEVSEPRSGAVARAVSVDLPSHHDSRPKASAGTDKDSIAEAFEATSKMSGFLDEGDMMAALAAARALTSLTNREVRVLVLEGLSWIGESAVMEMTCFLDDPDPEIRKAAEEIFWEAIGALEDPYLKVGLLEISLKSGRVDLRMGILDELLGLPEVLAFEPTAKMLDDPDQGVRELAIENLEFLSEEQFSSSAQAMQWFALNQDQLDPPEE